MDLNINSSWDRITRLCWENSWKFLSWGWDPDIGSGINSVSIWISVKGYFVSIA